MKLSNKDIQKLKEKGVDPSIILDLLLEDDDQGQDPGTTPETPKEEKTETPDQKKTETPKEEKPDQKTDMQDQILKAIEKLTGAVQTSNLLNAGSAGPDVDTTEDILASIINPKGGK